MNLKCWSDHYSVKYFEPSTGNRFRNIETGREELLKFFKLVDLVLIFPESQNFCKYYTAGFSDKPSIKLHSNRVEYNLASLQTVLTDDQKVKPVQNGSNFLYAYELPITCASSGSVSGDEERLSISSIKSTHREAAQTFTAIQRLVRPGSQANLGIEIRCRLGDGGLKRSLSVC